MSEKLVWGVPSFWIERLPIYYGQHKGFFREQDLSVGIRYFWGGPELARAVEQRQVLIGEMGLPPFFKSFSQGLAARVIGSSIIQQLDHYLVGKPEIEGMEDLKGKKIGILSFGSCDDYFIRFMLRCSSIDPDKDVEIFPLGDSYGRLEVFSSGKIDAGFLVEPFVALGESRGQIKILATVKDYFPSPSPTEEIGTIRYQWGIIFAHAELLERNLDLARRAMNGFRRSCRAIKENPEEAAAFGAQVFQLKTEVFQQALMRGLETWELDAQLDVEGMKNCVQSQETSFAPPAGAQKETAAISVELDLPAMVQQL